MLELLAQLPAQADQIDRRLGRCRRHAAVPRPCFGQRVVERHPLRAHPFFAVSFAHEAAAGLRQADAKLRLVEQLLDLVGKPADIARVGKQCRFTVDQVLLGPQAAGGYDRQFHEQGFHADARQSFERRRGKEQDVGTAKAVQRRRYRTRKRDRSGQAAEGGLQFLEIGGVVHAAEMGEMQVLARPPAQQLAGGVDKRFQILLGADAPHGDDQPACFRQRQALAQCGPGSRFVPGARQPDAAWNDVESVCRYAVRESADQWLRVGDDAVGQACHDLPQRVGREREKTQDIHVGAEDLADVPDVRGLGLRGRQCAFERIFRIGVDDPHLPGTDNFGQLPDAGLETGCAAEEMFLAGIPPVVHPVIDGFHLPLSQQFGEGAVPGGGDDGVEAGIEPRDQAEQAEVAARFAPRVRVQEQDDGFAGHGRREALWATRRARK